MSDRLARCTNRDYCTLGDRGTVLRIAAGDRFFCPECAHTLSQAPDRRGRPHVRDAEAARLARCPNTSYCSLATQGAIMRVAAGAPFVCPECAHALAATLDRRALPVPARPRWQPALAVCVTAATIAAVLIYAPRQPALQVKRRVAPPAPQSAFNWLGDPAPPALAAATIGLLPSWDGPLRERPRKISGPQLQTAAREAIASLHAGIPPLPGMPWHEASAGGTMPWRQALIMAALMNADRPPPVPMANPGIPALDAPQPTNAAGLPLLNAPPTETTLGTALLKGAAATLSTAALKTPRLLIVLPPPPALLPLALPKPSTLSGAAAIEQRPAELHQPAPLSLAEPRAVAPIAPNAWHVALGRNDSQQSTQPVVLLTPGQLTIAPPDSAAHVETPGTAPPHTGRIIVLPAATRFSFGYGPLKDIHLPEPETRSIFLPARPSTQKPRPGSLTVDCEVETTGVPSDCRVLSAHNASHVTQALLAWLVSGLVHYTPRMQEGAPVAARRTITVDFPAEAAR